MAGRKIPFAHGESVANPAFGVIPLGLIDTQKAQRYQGFSDLAILGTEDPFAFLER